MISLKNNIVPLPCEHVHYYQSADLCSFINSPYNLDYKIFFVDSEPLGVLWHKHVKESILQLLSSNSMTETLPTNI